MRMRSLRFLIAAWFFGALMTAAAQEAIPLTIEAKLGFDGALPLHGPFPVGLRVTNHGSESARLMVSLGQAQLIGNDLVSRPLEVSPGAVKQISLLGQSDWNRGLSLSIRSEQLLNLSVEAPEFSTAGGGIARGITLQSEGVPADLPLRVLFFGARARQLVNALRPPNRSGHYLLNDDGIHIASLSQEWAPDSSLAWSCAKLIFWSEPDPDSLPDPAQLDALLSWVRGGGTLVLLGARNPVGLRSSALAPHLPADIAGISERRYPSEQGLRQPIQGPVLKLRPRAGSKAQGFLDPDHPLVVRRAVGFGQIILPALAPSHYDVGRVAPLASALQGVSVERFTRSEGNISVLYNGYSPQFWANGRAFEHELRNGNLLRPPIAVFFLCGVLFLLLIGPVDYRILKRMGKLHWSPFTLLAYTILFTAISLGVSYYLFAPKAELNRIALVDLSETGDGVEVADGLLFHGLFCPAGGSLVIAPPEGEVFGQLIGESWNGGQALPTPQLWRAPGHQAPAARLPFNSYRQLATRIRTRAKGSLQARIEGRSVAARLVIVNDLGCDIGPGCFGWGDESMPVDAIPAGGRFDASLKPRLLNPESYGTPGHMNFVLPRDLLRLRNGVRDRIFAQSPVQGWRGLRLKQPQEAEASPPPWRLRESFIKDCGLYVATAETLPFDDGTRARYGGHDVIVIRRAVPLPQE